MGWWDGSFGYTIPFAAENVRGGGGLPPTLERLQAYCKMSVSEETRDMGDAGREAEGINDLGMRGSVRKAQNRAENRQWIHAAEGRRGRCRGRARSLNLRVEELIDPARMRGFPA